MTAVALKSQTNGTYWQVARAVVAAEPRATEAAATNAMVMGGGMGTATDSATIGCASSSAQAIGRVGEGLTHGRESAGCGGGAAGVGGEETHGSDLHFCVSVNRKTEVARDRPTRLPQDAVISPKKPPRPH